MNFVIEPAEPSLLPSLLPSQGSDARFHIRHVYWASRHHTAYTIALGGGAVRIEPCLVEVTLSGTPADAGLARRRDRRLASIEGVGQLQTHVD